MSDLIKKIEDSGIDTQSRIDPINLDDSFGRPPGMGINYGVSVDAIDFRSVSPGIREVEVTKVLVLLSNF